MEKWLDVTYYHHSGFSAAMDDVLLVFDYWLGEKGELPENKRITPEMLRDLCLGAVKLSIEDWRRVNKALDKLEEAERKAAVHG